MLRNKGQQGKQQDSGSSLPLIVYTIYTKALCIHKLGGKPMNCIVQVESGEEQLKSSNYL